MLMPEQLSPNTIDAGLESSDDTRVLRFRYDYENLPRGLMPRFIVKMNQYLTDQRTCWANGVVLYTGECKVLARCDHRSRRIAIFVHGPSSSERRDALKRLFARSLESVHNLFDEIGAIPMVPISPITDDAIEYARLVDFERKNLEHYAFGNAVYDVSGHIGGIAVLTIL
ncbi:MAG: COR domain-containing protein [Pirellulales bacterium]